MRLVDAVSKYINNPKYFEPFMSYQYFKMNNETIELDIITEEEQIMQVCNSSHIDNVTLYNENLFTYSCASLKNLSIGGNWDANEVYALSFRYDKCSKKQKKLMESNALPEMS